MTNSTVAAKQSRVSNFKTSALNDWYSTGSEKTLCGYSIYTNIHSNPDKPRVLLLHGFPTSSYDWLPIWNLLKKDYELVTLDLLGFGFSDKPDNHLYTIHEQADIVEALLAELASVSNDRDNHLLVHDYSVSVAQELLARQHEHNTSRLLSCCFLNGGLFPETHQALLIQKLLLSRVGKHITALTGFKQFSRSFSKVFGPQSKPSEQELEAFWELICFKNGKHLFHNVIKYMNDRKTHRDRWCSVLQDSEIPLSLINGSIDPVSGKHMVQRFKELNCRLDHLVELTTIGHYPQLEAPETIASRYRDFLAIVDAH